MDTTPHARLTSLFSQLGLPADGPSIRQFIHDHRPLDPKVPLYEAPWWNDSQSELLRRAIDEDADWAEDVDHLDALLRHTNAEAASEQNR
ncbi:MAG: DUF2789 family protein [Candidatus Competibacteraceae bacterium]|nr:DUF2789 family protein [Candidatus Competibacteraceae bacterium]